MSRTIRGGAVCPIARTVDVLKDPWTFLVLREAFAGVTRFSDFRANLGVATDVLTDRLNALVAAQVLRREQYQDAGSRARVGYHLTPAGAALAPVLAALQTWGDEHVPVDGGPAAVWRHRATGAPVGVAFVDADGRRLDEDEVSFERTAPQPA